MDKENFADVLAKKKAHRERRAGRKAERRKKRETHDQEFTEKQKNPKAFAFNSAVKAERKFRRKQDIETKKQHIPLVDRSPVEPPPILVGIVGPPKVGKSTLINSLIKLFTKSPLTDIKGPVTIVTGKKRRITLVECNNDINSMIDLAKVADLVLLLCDASFGFEMEIFEFLNICQVHGMPRIMGVLTHLDMIKNSKTLKNTKKTLKHRFWTEVYAGAKLFYLSGILHGEYLRNEVKNLGRFMSVIKLRPLVWRTNHSYLLGDRYEDLTSQESIRKNSKCDRNISLYGYVRGMPLNKSTSVHIAGLGDLQIHDISLLPDPCPLPETMKKRALVEKEKLIYAPFSGVGGIVYDKDAVYVELGGSHSHKQRDDNEYGNIVTNLINTKEALDVKMEHSELQLFTKGKKLIAKDLETIENNSENTVEDKQLYYKATQKSQTELDEELSNLRKNNLETISENSDIDIDTKLSFQHQINESENSLSHNDSTDDSDTDDGSDNEDNNKQVTTYSEPQYTVLKENKDSELHDKLTNILEKMHSKKLKSEKVVTAVNSEFSKNALQDELEKSGREDLQKTNKTFNKLMGKNVLSPGEDDADLDNHEQSSESESSISFSEENSSSEDDESKEENENEEHLEVNWKTNLAKKAQDAFFERQSKAQNIMKLVYGVFDTKLQNESSQLNANEQRNADAEIGGLFRLVSQEQQKQKMDKDNMNLPESALFEPPNLPIRNWLDPENKILIENCFVTGKWKNSEDAAELLKLDDVDDVNSEDLEMFGDFEDLETGEKFNTNNKIESNTPNQGIKRIKAEDEKDDKKALAEKKRKLKEKFDSEYDNTEKTYYDEFKINVEKQSQLNKTIFENMPDDVRVQIEGYRPGMYVRMEFQNVPAEFIDNFDPTYPLVVGALNMGEENIGFVNVKIKKHRWYKKILKTNDPLIISLGWRRFQILPTYSKLEDDLKFRYLKYTPQHVTCNAHFWGPITPQGTGFLALQSCEENYDVVKQGFRIAATGAVQELDKSTQIMKKLKLIGHPLKIYKKTAFIKGMFSSALEVAQFEGARIKTVSGIRGQIKKAVSKPEGCFRATFEDKIQLSDIIFCRTWFKVNVSQFYNPVITLLLPSEKKNSWRGVRTTGQIKREDGIKNQPNKDSLYKAIVREPKVFKPLVVPSKLEKALPYRDKSKYGILFSEKKKSVDRVAVIREPREQQVSSMMKMLRATFEHKQTQMKLTMKEKMEKHKQEIKEQELIKMKKLTQKKKMVMRGKSKAQIAQSKSSRR